MNLNRLFPRLSISAKLVTAFLLIALIPLGAVVVLGTVSTAREITERTGERLQHEVGTVALRTGRALRETSQHLLYLKDVRLGRPLLQDDASVDRHEARDASQFLVTNSSALFRVKVLDRLGAVRSGVVRPGTDFVASSVPGTSEPFYVWIASQLDDGEVRILPVEMRGRNRPEIIPAIAAVTPVRSAEGDLLGAVVGEARAIEVFTGVDEASPDLRGITGLVDREGRFLYHTGRKRDWATLLAERDEIGVKTEFGPEVADAILSGEIRSVQTERGDVVSFHPIPVDPGSTPPFILYRSVPLSGMQAPVRRYLATSGSVAVLATFSVLGMALIAARQFTWPLMKLREAVNHVAAGESYPKLEIQTNDEIEDLAEDFQTMSDEVRMHRRSLESVVEDTTRELRQTEKELSQLVALSADAIVSLDREGRVKTWNRGAEWLFGYSAEEATGEVLSDMIRPGSPRNTYEESYLEQTLEECGAVIAYQTSRRTKFGEEIPVGLTQTRLTDEEGRDVGSSVIFRDNRMNERMQEELRRSERMAAVSVMAAGLAHELKNPLAIVRNRIELMRRDAREDGGSGRAQEDLQVLQQYVGRIERIAADLFHFARNGSDDVDQIGPVPIDEVIGRVAVLLERVLAPHQVALEMKLEEEIPPVLGNATALETTLVNLVINAQQAIGDDGRVTVETRWVKDLHLAEIEVRDTGPGVPEEARGQIYEPFFTTKASTGGTGLGLTVCRTLMERQGGSIQLVNPGDDTGAAFVLSFPIYSNSVERS